MRILEINTEKTWRGGERQTLFTVEGLVEKENTVTLFCLQGSPLAIKINGQTLIKATSQAALLVHLIFNARNYDIIHVQNSKALIWAILSKLFHKVPVVYTRRVDFKPKGFLTLWKYKQAGKIIAISEAISNILKSQGIQDVEVIPDMVKDHPLKKELADKIIAELGISGKKIIATTASFVPHKDPETMVRVIAELKNTRSDFVFLHFGDGELLEEIKFMVEKWNLENTYIFMGFHENAEDFFSVMDVFAMSSQEEGLGSSVLDAFLYEVPVASTDAGGLKETVEGYGLVSPVKDYMALAANINLLMNDIELRKTLTIKAKKRVAEKYSIEANINKYLELFKKLTN